MTSKTTGATLFRTKELSIIPFDENNILPILDVYRLSEDFLSLGPVSKASLTMVSDDIKYSKNKNGRYCCIRTSSRHIVGVLDFIPVTKEPGNSFLTLIMIGPLWRRKGYGKAVIFALEKYLIKSYKTTRIKSAVQINNNGAIQFWRNVGYDVDITPEHRPDNTIVYNMSKELPKKK